MPMSLLRFFWERGSLFHKVLQNKWARNSAGWVPPSLRYAVMPSKPAASYPGESMSPKKKGLELKLKSTRGPWFIYDWVEEIDYMTSESSKEVPWVTSQEETQPQLINLQKGCSPGQWRKYSQHSRLRRDWEPLSSVWKPLFEDLLQKHGQMQITWKAASPGKSQLTFYSKELLWGEMR